MKPVICATVRATLALGVSAAAATAQEAQPTPPPPPPVFEAQGKPNFVGVSEMLRFEALETYHEPEYVTRDFVEPGRLPPVEERLPAEPMVYRTSNMPDGVGVYGDVMRHVIGGRPEGWNYWAGQTQGWGGIDIGMLECLTRTGPLFQIRAEELEPLPNLARSWEWSEDGQQLTMRLVEGARWSDGDPFDADDVMFYWEDILLDPQLTPANGASPELFGEGTTLEALDPYTIRWTFRDAYPRQYLYNMGYGHFCPGPSHLLRPEHPSHNPDATYESFREAFPPEYMNFPVMGAWVPVEYRPDALIVLRRNPYFWKVDEAGNQLPYLNEVHYRLSTWADRDIQAAAGTGDYSNLEQPENYVEALRRSAQPEAPARLEFGPRTIGYSMYFNFSAAGWGGPDERAQAVRELNRNLDFRIAISSAIDRQRLGQSLVKGPFTAIYPGGIYTSSAYYDAASTTYFPYDVDVARAYLQRAGLVDTDGNGFVNWPEDTLGGEDVQIVLLCQNEIQTNANVGEAVIAMLGEVGIRVVGNFQSSTTTDALRASGEWDWYIHRNTSELITVVQNTPLLAPMGPRISIAHYAGPDGTLDLVPFEEEMVEIVGDFIASDDADERVALMRRYRDVYTRNVFAVGLTTYSAALVVHRRFANLPPGAPNFMFNWGEDSIMRERMFVPLDRQEDFELRPGTLPGLPGETG